MAHMRLGDDLVVSCVTLACVWILGNVQTFRGGACDDMLSMLLGCDNVLPFPVCNLGLRV